MNAAV
jgi:hypothetical protein